MKIFRTLAVVAALLVLPLAMHASPSDALAVLQQCGRPVSDVTTQGSTEYPGPLRVMTYRSATLHFQHSGDGWNFIFANPAGASHVRDRMQTAQMLPCFHRAMNDVRIYTPIPSTASTASLPSTSRPAAKTSASGKLHMQPIESTRPLFYVLLLLLYVLPTIVGLIRRPAGLSRLVLINLLLGWTVVGWGYALLLANEDRAEPGEGAGEFTPAAAVPLLVGNVIELKLSAAAQDEEESFAEPVVQPAEAKKAWSEPIVLQRAQPAAAAADEQASPAASPERSKPLSFAFASGTPAPAMPEPDIRWTDYFTPQRRCRIDVVSNASQVTIYDIDVTQRGTDPLGREVIGGYVGKSFMVFPIEKILHLRDLAA